MNRDEVFAGVCECLTVVLDVPAGSIREEQKLIGDLGADSLDLLDLTFHLETKFGVKISPREIQRRAREKLGDTPFVIDGKYTPEALAELRTAMPEVPPEELVDGLSEDALPRRLRVASMVNLVWRLLQEQKAAAPAK